MNIYLYILDTLADWEISNILAELNSGRFIYDKSKDFRIVKISNSLNPIRTMGGLEIKPEETIYDVVFNKDDILILPGADTWFDPQNFNVLKIIDALLQQGITICAICGATVALAEAGMLDTRKHTSNDKEFLKMFSKNYTGSNNYLNDPVVIDGNLITASGLAPLEFSYQVLKATCLFRNATLESWYKLYSTRDSKYFFELMDTLK